MEKLDNLDLSKKKYIIFDLDGTLIDSIGMWNLTDYCIIKNFGEVEVSEETIQNDRDNFLHNNTSGEVFVGYCKYLIDKYNLSIQDGASLSSIRRSFYEELYNNEVNFKPYVVELLKELKNKGHTLILASMSSKNQIDIYSKNRKLTSEVNIKDIFDLITTKEMVTKKKPDPEIYENIINYFNTSPTECLVFEDSYSGCLASKNAGIDTVNIYDKYSDKYRSKIDSIADYCILDYSEILNLLKIKKKKINS